MNKKQRMNEQIAIHGANLNKIFSTQLDDVTLAKRLHSLEVKAHNLITKECNGEIEELESIKINADIRKKIIKLLGLKPSGNMTIDDCYPAFINGDARGYALKLSDSYVRENNIQIYKDWGGYGILAPEFDSN